MTLSERIRSVGHDDTIIARLKESKKRLTRNPSVDYVQDGIYRIIRLDDPEKIIAYDILEHFTTLIEFQDQEIIRYQEINL